MEADTLRDERLLLVERLRGLADGDWARPSLCAGWTIRHVLAHLVTPFVVSPPAMAMAFARHRGIGRGMDATARRIAEERRLEDLLDILEQNAASTVRPPGLPLAAPLTDAVAHSADIRWALGDPRGDWSEPERLRPVLEFLTGPRAVAGFVPPGRLRGFALAADDQPWSRGAGEMVQGPSLALVMAMLGREAAFGALSGAGAARLAAA